jgi:hypothetical protein
MFFGIIRLAAVTGTTLVLVTVLPTSSRGQKEGGDKESVVKEISLKDLKLGPASPNNDVKKRTNITSAAQLAKAFPDKDTLDKIAKHVDFAKQYLVYFRWSGSGGDKLTVSIDKTASKPAVIFEYVAGLTDDLRQHAKLFAIDKSAGYSILR